MFADGGEWATGAEGVQPTNLIAPSMGRVAMSTEKRKQPVSRCRDRMRVTPSLALPSRTVVYFGIRSLD